MEHYGVSRGVAEFNNSQLLQVNLAATSGMAQKEQVGRLRYENFVFASLYPAATEVETSMPLSLQNFTVGWCCWAPALEIEPGFEFVGGVRRPVRSSSGRFGSVRYLSTQMQGERDAGAGGER